MNGKMKFHKANGPALNAGERWVSCAGKIRCEIVSVRKYGDEKWGLRSHVQVRRWRTKQEECLELPSSLRAQRRSAPVT